MTKGNLSDGGWVPHLWTGMSIAVCYFKAISAATLPRLGVDWNINPHIQAVLMWVFGLLAVIAIYRELHKHGDKRPTYISITGFIVMVGTLYTYYDVVILFLGYLLLLIGSFANQKATYDKLHQKVLLQTEELANWNKTLETRVEEQVAELERVGQLKNFLPPEVADLIVKQKGRSVLESHRSHIAALCCDLRGFTTFSEHAEPEEVMDILISYHQHLGKLVQEHGGTILHRAGDGLMVIFNDPLPCDEPVRRASELAFSAHVALRQSFNKWAQYGHHLGLGVGIASGYATLGIVGDDRQSDYTAIGNVINLTSRLCENAQDGQTLISKKAYLDITESVAGEEVSGLELKGIMRAQAVYNISPKSDSKRGNDNLA